VSETGLERLRALLLEQGGLLATLLAPAPASDSDPPPASVPASDPATLAADGPRARGNRGEYELLVEAIYEGYLLHYCAPRLLLVGEADLGLLAGDQLYAIGLARLVALGDTSAVAELADTITLSALAHGAGRPALAEAAWAAGARAVGWGPSEDHARAKARAFDGDWEAIEAMRTSV
jgi:hypothetical protein